MTDISKITEELREIDVCRNRLLKSLENAYHKLFCDKHGIEQGKDFTVDGRNCHMISTWIDQESYKPVYKVYPYKLNGEPSLKAVILKKSHVIKTK